MDDELEAKGSPLRSLARFVRSHCIQQACEHVGLLPPRAPQLNQFTTTSRGQTSSRRRPCLPATLLLSWLTDPAGIKSCVEFGRLHLLAHVTLLSLNVEYSC